MALSGDHSINAQPGAKFTRKQVYWLSKQFVYPPCKKAPDAIRMDDDLAADLGYKGNSKHILAPKTNKTFALTPPNDFNGPEMMTLGTVADHVAATCKKLKDDGRLIP